MKRYKLLKELPTFDAGDEFYLDSNNNLYHNGSEVMAYSHKTLEKFPNILTDWFEEIPEEYKRWRAKYGEEYWCICGNSHIYCSTEDEHSTDSYRFNTGNYFKTEEEAEAYQKYLIARQALLDDAKGGKWKKDGSNIYAYYDYDEDDWEYDDTLDGTQAIGIIYFQNLDDIQKSLEEHKEQWEIVREYEMGEV